MKNTSSVVLVATAIFQLAIGTLNTPAFVTTSVPSPTAATIRNDFYSLPQITAAAKAPNFELLRRQAATSLMGWESVSGSYRSVNCPASRELLFSSSYGGCCKATSDCSIATACTAGYLSFGQGGISSCSNGCGLATWRRNVGDVTGWRIYECNPAAGRNLPSVMYQNNPSSSSSSSSSGSSTSSSSSPSADAATSGGKKQKKNIGAIVGGVVGGVLGLALIIALVVGLLCFRRKKHSQAIEAETFAASSMPPSAYTVPAVPVGKGSFYGGSSTQAVSPVAYSQADQYQQPTTHYQQPQQPPYQEQQTAYHQPQPQYQPPSQQMQQSQYHDTRPVSGAVSPSQMSSISSQGFHDPQTYPYPPPTQYTGHQSYHEGQAEGPRYPGARTYAPPSGAQRTSGSGW